MRLFLLIHFCSFNTVRVCSVDMIYQLFSPVKETSDKTKFSELNDPSPPPQKNDMSFHLCQTVRIRSDVMHLKKKKQRQYHNDKQTTCLNLYLSNHQCFVSTLWRQLIRSLIVTTVTMPAGQKKCSFFLGTTPCFTSQML